MDDHGALTALTTLARALVDDSLYMTLGTADEAGHPWVSPVYFAPVGYREFLWVSRTYRRHSQNLAVRPEVSIVIFDSTVPINTGRAVYVDGLAGEVPADLLADRLEHYSHRAVAHGSSPVTVAEVTGAVPHRLYRATATHIWALDENDDRIPVTP